MLCNVADVIAAVNFAREQALLLAVRGGSHNGGGLGVCDDGLVIDLSGMRGVRVDPVARHRARRRRLYTGRCRPRHPRLRPGDAFWHHVHDRSCRIDARRWAGPSDTQRVGLSIDNLLEADVVLADGRLVTASEREHD